MTENIPHIIELVIKIVFLAIVAISLVRLGFDLIRRES